MIKKLLFLLAVLLITAGLFLFVKVLNSFKTPGKGALQVTTNIKSKVFLNGEEIGTAPLCKCNEGETLPSGKYDLRIEPEDKTLSAFNSKISINGGVLTAVERTFLPGAYASASILTLEKTDKSKPELIITSLPDNVMVTIDSVSQGVTPFKTNSLSASEHELKLTKEGFQEKTLHIKMIENHRLIIEDYLGNVNNDISLEDDGSGTEENTSDPQNQEQKQDTITVTILNTPTGFLRVREDAGIGFSEIGRVDVGSSYILLSEKDGWYEIEFEEGKTGWISSQYAREN